MQQYCNCMFSWRNVPAGKRAPEVHLSSSLSEKALEIKISLLFPVIYLILNIDIASFRKLSSKVWEVHIDLILNLQKFYILEDSSQIIPLDYSGNKFRLIHIFFVLRHQLPKSSIY